MKYPELFEMSAQQYPQGGVRLSPAACGFISPEVDARIEHLNSELKDPEMSETLRRMCAHHLEGLLEIKRLLEEGFQNKEGGE